MKVMLHIGKTGGSYCRHVIEAAPQARDSVLFLDHSFSLDEALTRYPDRQAIFGLRDPIEIFVSGFNSRLRKGLPRYDSPWSPDEKIAFAAFRNANSLAESLSDGDSEARELAAFSMRGIMHVSRGLRYYLHSAQTVRRHKPRISFIFRQRCLDDDIQKFFAKNGVTHRHMPIQDDVVRHKNPAGTDKNLSAKALDNLRLWYAADIEIYRTCAFLASEINSDAA